MKKGFTLIELLVVIAIIGILATLVITQVSGAQQKARNAQAKSDITAMGKGIELYKSDDANGGATVIGVTTAGTAAALTTAGCAASPVVAGSSSLLCSTFAAGTPAIATMFSCTQLYSATNGSGTYGTGVTKTPSSSHAYSYRSENGTNASTGYVVWTTVTSGGSVTDTSYCVKNGTSLNGTAATTVPTNCTP